MARKDGKAEVQHWVPQLLIRPHGTDPFAKRGTEQIWCFDKQTDRVFSTNIKGIAAGRDFYEADIDGVSLTLEERLGKLETRVSPILAGIVEHRSLANLDFAARKWVAVFMAIQFVRTRAFREYLLNTNHSLAARLREDGIDLSKISNFKMLSEDDAKKVSLWMLSNADRELEPHFYNKHWYLIEGRYDDPFHLGDNPVVQENEFDLGQPTMGLASPGMSIYLPLCPTLCLGMVDTVVARHVKRSCDLARRLLEQAEKRAKKKSRRLGIDLVEPMREVIVSRQKMESHVAAFRKGTPTSYDHEVVTHINSLQMMYAGRWVMSSRNDFSLPRTMITRDERFRRSLTTPEFVRVRIDDHEHPTDRQL